jgi:hypothetical protein
MGFSAWETKNSSANATCKFSVQHRWWTYLFYLALTLISYNRTLGTHHRGNPSWLPGADDLGTWTNQSWTCSYVSVYSPSYYGCEVHYGCAGWPLPRIYWDGLAERRTRPDGHVTTWTDARTPGPWGVLAQRLVGLRHACLISSPAVNEGRHKPLPPSSSRVPPI